MTARDAAAGAFYIETAGGASRFSSADSLFLGSSPDRLGLGLNMSFMATLGSGNAVVEFQGGLQTRISTASGASGSYGLLSAYPVIRMQISRAYIGGGVTPFVWRRAASSPGFLDYLPPPAPIAYFAEAGVLWPVVPIFSLGLAGSAEWVSSGGATSPAPAIQGVLLMRFYFGFWSSGGSSSTSNEFKGWRYPFGNWMGN